MDPPQLLTSELDIGVGTLQVTSVIFDGFPVAKGSCIVGLSLNGEKGTLKFGVHLAVKNDYGRWQVIRGGS